MESEYTPLLLGTHIIKPTTTVINLYSKHIEITVPNTFMEQLATLCDGTRQERKVLEALSQSWDMESVNALLSRLKHEGVLVDSRHVGTHLLSLVSNPAPFAFSLTDSQIRGLVKRSSDFHSKQSGSHHLQAPQSHISDLLDQRASVREFSDVPVGSDAVSAMLWSAYGQLPFQSKDEFVVHRTVPSAGALYPLLIHLILFKATDQLPAGIYSASFTDDRSVHLQCISTKPELCLLGFLDPMMVEYSTGCIVISGSFMVSSRKYGNRSLLYVPLEAGHVAQNVHLRAYELGVSTVEIGGFIEETLVEYLKLSSGYQPLTTIVFGMKGSTKSETQESPLIESDWAVTRLSGYQLPFTMAFAWSPRDKESISCGRSLSPTIAYAKARSELIERVACSCISSEIIEDSFAHLENPVHPECIVKFSEHQYTDDAFPFKIFKENALYQWVPGYDVFSDRNVYVLADTVYYPYRNPDTQFVYANSSGVAAHPDAHKALENAVLELIERDAFMLVYLLQLRMSLVRLTSLPEYLIQRIEAVNTLGFEITVMNFDFGFVPVIFVYCQNRDLTFTTCAASAHYDAEEALHHALMEVESSVLSKLSRASATNILPEQVASSEDHGVLYEQPEYFRRADFMIDHSSECDLHEISRPHVQSFDQLLLTLNKQGLSLYSIALDARAYFGCEVGVHVVRAIIPGLIPISFGYGQEPCGMERLRTVSKQCKGYVTPAHLLNQFPHLYN